GGANCDLLTTRDHAGLSTGYSGFLIIRPMLAVLLSVGLLSVLSYGIGTTVGIGLWVAQPPLRHGDIVQYADYLDAASGHYNLAFSRVLALEGETIEAKQGVWRRNGRVIETTNLGELMIPGGARSHNPLRGVRFERTEGGRSYSVMRDADWPEFKPADSFGPVKVPPGHVYLIGDHLDRAYDSRAFGSIRAKHIVGRVVPMRTFAER
ncbi:MAG: signal peptidase I, partial [Myxococcota bacterium]